jgi:hypothetical protein
MAINPVSPTHNGWHWSDDDARLNFYYRGTRAGHITAAGLVPVAAFTATTTVTAGTGSTTTTGNTVNTAGDVRVTAGNVRLGVVSAFASTEPTSTIVFKQGTAPVGAVATSGALYTNGTVMLKMIADGTASNVET